MHARKPRHEKTENIMLDGLMMGHGMIKREEMEKTGKGRAGGSTAVSEHT